MKRYPRILSVFLALLLLLGTLLSCSPTPVSEPPVDDPSIDKLPVDDPPKQDPPEQDPPAVEPPEEEPPVEEPPVVEPPMDEPKKPQPKNSFSPVSDLAGKPFLNETQAPLASVGNGIRRFMMLTEHNPALPFNVACHISQTRITAMLPAGIDLSAVTVNFLSASDIMLGDKVLTDGCVLDLREPLVLSVKTTSGERMDVVLDVQTLRTGLPSVALTVDDFAEINSKTEYFKSTFYVGGGDGAICDYATDLTLLVDAEAKGRGNSSWAYPKKSFTVKLAEKKNLLGLGRSRNWTLVSNYQDKTLMRNEIAAQISTIVGLPTMETRSVDLWLNGVYWGNYLLIEKVEFEKERIDLPDYDEVENPADAGILLEWDGHVNEVPDWQKAQWQQVTEHTVYDPVADIHFIRLDGSFIVIQKPSAANILPEQIERAEDIVLLVDTALKSRNYDLLETCIDMESFAAWYLVEDIMKNMDARFHSSCYMYFGGDGVLHMGPVWDFDMSLGNANYGGVNDPSGTHISTSKWYKHLFAMEEFCELVSDMLMVYGEELDALPDYMEVYAAMLDRSQAYNFERWDILNTAVGWNPQNVVEANTYPKQIKLMQDFYVTRLDVVRELVAGLGKAAKPSTSVQKPTGQPTPPKGGVVLWSGDKSTTDGRSLKCMLNFEPAFDLSAYAEDGVVCLTYWISSLDTLTSGHQLELTSSGGSDRGEFSWGLNPAKQMKAGSWQTLYLPLSEATRLDRDVAADWSKINFFRIYVHVGSTEHFYVADLRVVHADEIK